MTVAFHLSANGRRGRVYVASPADFGPDVEKASIAAFMDEEDAARDVLLRELLGKTVVVAWAHPGVDPDDVIHTYLQPFDGGERLFACAIASQARLEQMLDEAPAVLEGFSLQVVESRHLTVDSIRAAVQAWAERNYPDLPLPAFLVEPWRPSVEIPEGEARADAPDADGPTGLVELDAEVLKIGSREMPRQAVA